MTTTVPPELLAALPYIGWTLLAMALLLFFGRAWVRQLFESENKPSIRKVAFFLVVLAVLRFADFSAQAVIDAVLLFGSSLVIAGTAKTTISRFAPKPTVDPTEQPDKGADKEA